MLEREAGGGVGWVRGQPTTHKLMCNARARARAHTHTHTHTHGGLNRRRNGDDRRRPPLPVRARGLVSRDASARQ